MSNWYSKVDVSSGGGERTELPEGAYTANPKARNRVGDSLFLIKRLDPKPVGDGHVTRHTFLVGSDGVRGTAFLKIDLREWWLKPEAIAMALKKRDAEIAPEVVQHLDTDMLAAIDAQIRHEAEDKVTAANTPDEAFADAVETAIVNTLLQIQINVGTIFRLCDWAGVERDPNVDLGSLEGTTFQGAVKHRAFTGGSSKEAWVYSKPANGSQTPAPNKQTSFDPTEFASGV